MTIPTNMFRINRWKKKTNSRKNITARPKSYFTGTKSMFEESTAVHITSIHPSVVMILNKVIMESKTLSKLESVLTHSPP